MSESLELEPAKAVNVALYLYGKSGRLVTVKVPRDVADSLAYRIRCGYDLDITGDNGEKYYFLGGFAKWCRISELNINAMYR